MQPDSSTSCSSSSCHYATRISHLSVPRCRSSAVRYLRVHSELHPELRVQQSDVLYRVGVLDLFQQRQNEVPAGCGIHSACSSSAAVAAVAVIVASAAVTAATATTATSSSSSSSSVNHYTEALHCSKLTEGQHSCSACACRQHCQRDKLLTTSMPTLCVSLHVSIVRYILQALL
jgi:hypothetical protein